MTRELVVDAQLARYKVPTWWVGKDLFQALLGTEPPTDMLLEELLWPMPAMLFMLPTEETRREFGRNVPFVAGCAIEPAPHDQIFTLPVVNGIRTSKVLMEPAKSGGIVVKAAEWHFNGHTDGCLSVAARNGDAFGTMLSSKWAIQAGPNCNVWPEDAARIDRLTSMFVQLLLLMSDSTHSNLMTGGDVAIQGLTKGKGESKQVVRPTLFNPKWVGEHYRLKRLPAPEGDGHHASPKPHWRKAHWRKAHWHKYAVGPGRTERRRIWLEPIQVSWDL